MVSEKIKAKAEMLVQDKKVKKDIETERRIHFFVQGTDEVHSVIFDKVKNDWTCDCSYSSLKSKVCSHIIACQTMKEN
jgi:hypothetical protein